MKLCILVFWWVMIMWRCSKWIVPQRASGRWRKRNFYEIVIDIEMVLHVFYFPKKQFLILDSYFPFLLSFMRKKSYDGFELIFRLSIVDDHWSVSQGVKIQGYWICYEIVRGNIFSIANRCLILNILNRRYFLYVHQLVISLKYLALHWQISLIL